MNTDSRTVNYQHQKRPIYYTVTETRTSGYEFSVVNEGDQDN